MILTAHQPTYMPWLGLFHKIALADMFISYNQVQYQVYDWNNRNHILTRYGPKWLTVPVFHKGHFDTTINTIKIDMKNPWRRKHWTAIQHAYSKTPYFKKYSDFFADIYSRDWTYLVDLNEYLLIGLLDILRIKVPVYSAGNWVFKGTKSDRVLDMCQQVGATHFVFGKHGKDYANFESFNKANITIYFQDYMHPTYVQHFEGFSPYMSIIDLLFNCGDDSLDVLMESNIKSVL